MFKPKCIGWLLEIGYVALAARIWFASALSIRPCRPQPDDPDTRSNSEHVANISLQSSHSWYTADALQLMESEGSSWYNGLEASLTKRLSHGFNSWLPTLSRRLWTPMARTSTQRLQAMHLHSEIKTRPERWGRASFRPHSSISSLATTWTLPGPSVDAACLLGGWDVAAVATIQSGTALTIANTNANNVFGISEDRAQLSGSCSKNQLVKGGAVESKLGGYFNTTCFTTPAIIGADGIGTAFGNSGTGIANGPGQANLDLAFSKNVPLNWPVEKSSIQFRAEFFNALNHPQFANPDTNFTSATFGVISSTAVNPRVGQLALRFAF